MEQPSEASSNNNQPAMDYSEEMLSLMRSIHSMMQAREEREASVLRSAAPTPAPVPPQLKSNIPMPVKEPTSSGQAGDHLATPDPPNNTLPAQASDPPAGTLTNILSSLHEAISDLNHAVTGSEKKMEQGTKNGPFKARRFGLKKDQAVHDPLAGMHNFHVFGFNIVDR
ncbi:hypothetical protein BDP27DRAFT_730356 [Rhodocollybia butyracea]|uniref:Uncharacterized protein n=1 Tax=Rhodocollybia butyracea TaxID=206335 RepID=A0A9P5PVK3_9AGAR|nr:hypothetical protein BDP27DRAFT_730356 [Rhodocollybia butyracea]